MHPFRKLREGGPMTPAQAAVVLNENVVMHTPVLIKPIVGRALVSIAISISTQSRDDPGKYIFEGKIDARTTFLRWQGTVQGHNIESLELLTDDESGLLLERTIAARVMTMVEHDLKPGDWLAQTAAGSTVGQLVLQLARSERFRTVNIVRRRAQVPDIKALGGEVLITSEDNDWGTQLATASEGQALSRAIDCVAGRTGATVARHLAPGGRMLVYGALSSHRQTDPSAFEMPVFAPRLIYSAAAVQGWYLLHWLEVTPLAESGAISAEVLDRLASGALRLPPAKRYRPQNIADALRDADGAPPEGKPLLDLGSWAAE